MSRVGELWDLAQRAEGIKRTLGVRRAAGFLRNRGVSIEGALWILLRV